MSSSVKMTKLSSRKQRQTIDILFFRFIGSSWLSQQLHQILQTNS